MKSFWYIKWNSKNSLQVQKFCTGKRAGRSICVFYLPSTTDIFNGTPFSIPSCLWTGLFAWTNGRRCFSFDWSAGEIGELGSVLSQHLIFPWESRQQEEKLSRYLDMPAFGGICSNRIKKQSNYSGINYFFLSLE